jgi:hypothetical protein
MGHQHLDAAKLLIERDQAPEGRPAAEDTADGVNVAAACSRAAAARVNRCETA